MKIQHAQPHHRVELPFTRDAPATARAYLRVCAPELSGTVLDDALVMVSELVTNAIEHGMPEVTLKLWRAADCLTVAVLDGGTAPLPVICPAPPGDHPNGRGLMIVNALAAHWGVHRTLGEAGNTVWFDLAPGGDPV